MTTRTARCACGALSVTAVGQPIKVSACHCHACQRRTGSAFSVAVFYDRDRVTLDGASKTFVRPGDSGQNVEFHFCPTCGVETYAFAEGKDGTPMMAVNVNCLDGVDPRALKSHHADGRSL